MYNSKPKHRFYISPENISDNSIVITQPEYHHIVNVIRYKKGNAVCLFDGKGNEYLGDISYIDKSNKVVKVEIRDIHRGEAVDRPMILIQSLIKGSKMDFIIQKATEIGVTNIFPVRTEYSVVKLDAKKENSKLAKWNRIMQESAKQCSRVRLPILNRVLNLDEVLNTLDRVDTKIICTIQDIGMDLRKIPDKNSKSLAVAVGPEGGFSEREIKLAQDKNWIPMCVGNIILRAETAAIAMLSVLSYKFGFWK